jgi:hypothetical protein
MRKIFLLGFFLLSTQARAEGFICVSNESRDEQEIQLVQRESGFAYSLAVEPGNYSCLALPSETLMYQFLPPEGDWSSCAGLFVHSRQWIVLRESPSGGRGCEVQEERLGMKMGGYQFKAWIRFENKSKDTITLVPKADCAEQMPNYPPMKPGDVLERQAGFFPGDCPWGSTVIFWIYMPGLPLYADALYGFSMADKSHINCTIYNTGGRIKCETNGRNVVTTITDK